MNYKLLKIHRKVVKGVFDKYPSVPFESAYVMLEEFFKLSSGRRFYPVVDIIAILHCPIKSRTQHDWVDDDHIIGMFKFPALLTAYRGDAKFGGDFLSDLSLHSDTLPCLISNPESSFNLVQYINGEKVPLHMFFDEKQYIIKWYITSNEVSSHVDLDDTGRLVSFIKKTNEELIRVY